MVPRRPAAYHGRRQMLRRLRIENLVLIHEAELALAPGLNAITGETGAGKTILAQAIGLLLGAKGEESYIGPDGDEAYVEAELDLPVALLDEEELASLAELQPADEEGLTLARRVFADGRTRAYAWGRGAAREDLAAVGERLIAMSGQFEQRRLARSSYQLELLDSFIGEEQLRRSADARLAWRQLAAARKRHDELQTGADAEHARVAELRALVEDTAGMEPEAERQLHDERERLRHVTELAHGAAAAVDALDEGFDPLAAAAEALATEEEKVGRFAAELHAARAGAAPRFAEEVARELAGVGMGEGEFVAEVREHDPGPTGVDEVAFLIRPNAGLPLAPVTETASGGELSRIALAIAAVAGGETIVFDEIDAGIGGETAHRVAETLQRLAQRAQVVTITHLPQIASVADRHFRVEKIPGDPTHTRIPAPDEAERRDELQRMLGGREFLSSVRT